MIQLLKLEPFKGASSCLFKIIRLLGQFVLLVLECLLGHLSEDLLVVTVCERRRRSILEKMILGVGASLSRTCSFLKLLIVDNYRDLVSHLDGLEGSLEYALLLSIQIEQVRMVVIALAFLLKHGL